MPSVIALSLPETGILRGVLVVDRTALVDPGLKALYRGRADEVQGLSGETPPTIHKGMLLEWYPGGYSGPGTRTPPDTVVISNTRKGRP
jgi:hypothetical protein